MRWLLVEYLCKGLFLGLLAFVAVKQAGAVPPDWSRTALVAGAMAGGLALGLLAAAVRYRREAARAAGKLVPFALFLMLESPAAVYAGLLAGLAAGAAALASPADAGLLLSTVGGGAALGVALAGLRVLPVTARLVVGFAAAAVLVAFADRLFDAPPDWLRDKSTLGVHVLLGLPFFYLLTFVGHAEESEVETAAWCGALAVGLYFVQITPNSPRIGYLVPVTAYFLYATYVLPGLRVFKLTLRGHTDLQLGRLRPALEKFRRARQLAPNDRAARDGLWEVHRRIDLRAADADPALLELLDLEMCLDRAGRLLAAGRPDGGELEEAGRLLDLVAARRPDLKAEVEYQRAVADLYAGRTDDAAGRLGELLDPGRWPPADPSRRNVLLAAWQLALIRHRGLSQAVGRPQLGLPGRRAEAIAAVEDYLAAVPGDQDVQGLRRLVYQDVTEAEYEAAAGPAGFAEKFGHDFALELGLALVEDPERWRRGAEYLRMAARGLPARRPGIFAQLAKAAEAAGDRDAARSAYASAVREGRAFGPANLGPDDRTAYFATVKWVADDADARGDLDAAIDHFRLYREYERSGVETLRRLADLYQRKHDWLAAIRATEEALQYAGASKDKDLAARKGAYYRELDPAAVAALPDEAKAFLDFDYCVKNARTALDAPASDDDALELVEWASQLAALASAIRPASFAARVVAARAAFRRGERDEGLRLLEDVRCGKPEKFAGTDEEDAWYQSCQMLGPIYLDEFDQPDLAIAALNDFRKSPKSGANTLYHLGRAYERKGDPGAAAKYFKAVTAYEGHPLYYEAREALRRVGGG